MINVVIGPNGFGKTYHLTEEKDRLIKNGVSENKILFLESEILLADEVKDTKDETKTMEYILTEILQTPDISLDKQKLKNDIDKEIQAHTVDLNDIVDNVMTTNGEKRNGDFITTSKNIQYKKEVSISGQKDFLNKTGSGQRMQLLLSFVKKSSKEYIFLDEPEKYSHPSMLNKTASLIMDLDHSSKHIYLATHSPKLLSMINVPLKNIGVINDSSHKVKSLNFESAIKELNLKLPISNFCNYEKAFYDETQIEHHIKEMCYRNFLEALFAKKIYFCEGLNDRSFLNKYLQDNNLFYDDYFIFPTFGKHLMPLFAILFKNLGGYNISLLFDTDNIMKDSKINKVLQSLNLHYYNFSPNIEKELKYLGKKSDVVGFVDFLSNNGNLPQSKYNL